MNDPASPAAAAPWWRHGMVWFVIAWPAAAIVAGFTTLAIALAIPDPVLTTRETPAVQGRNHAAKPLAPAPAPTSPR